MNSPYLTKYERARVLGQRALQISLGACPMVDLDGEVNPLNIAEKELDAGKLPMVVKRKIGSITKIINVEETAKE